MLFCAHRKFQLPRERVLDTKNSNFDLRQCETTLIDFHLKAATVKNSNDNIWCLNFLMEVLTI